MKKDKPYSNITISPLEHSEVLIEGEITAEYLEEKRAEALKKLVTGAEIPGFRKGTAPEHLVVRHFGESRILENAAQDVIEAQYWDIVADNSLRAIGTPDITITKLAAGNPLGFKIKTAVMPEVTLPDYEALARKVNAEPQETLSVDDKEIDSALEQLKEVKKVETIDDAFAQSLGDFKTLDELKSKISENMLAEKNVRAKEKRRLAILEAILAETTFPVPQVLVDFELQKMIAQFKDDVARAGLEYSSYLKQINKTEADIATEWKESAIKRARTQLIFGKISKDKQLVPDEKTIEHEVDHIIEHHKDADRFRARMFVENMLTNEKVLEFLENQK